MNSCAFEGEELKKKKMHILTSSPLVKHEHMLMEQIQPFQLPCSTNVVFSRWICSDLDQPSETKLTSAPMYKLSASHRLPFPGTVFSCWKGFKSTGKISFLLWKFTHTVVHWDLLIL